MRVDDATERGQLAAGDPGEGSWRLESREGSWRLESREGSWRLETREGSWRLETREARQHGIGSSESESR